MNRLFRTGAPSFPTVLASMGMTLAAAGLACAGEPAPATGPRTHTFIKNTSADSARTAEWTDGKLKIALKSNNDEITAQVNGREVLSFSAEDARDEASDIRAECTEGGREVKFAVEGGVLRATVDGDDAVTLSLTDDGFAVGGWAGSADFSKELAERLEKEGLRLHELKDRLRGARAFALAGDAPKVMIGVTMESGDEVEGISLPEGIDPAAVTVITRVIEGLPADKAGIQEEDIVTRVNGKSPANPPAIREALKDKNAGDALALTLYRDGQNKDVKLDLAAYDEVRLGGSPGSFWTGSGGAPTWSFSIDDNMHELAGLQERLGEMNARLSELGRQLADATGREARDLAKEMAELGTQMAGIGGEMARLSARGIAVTPVPPIPPAAPGATTAPAPRLVIPRNHRGQAIVVPSQPGASAGQAGAESEERVTALEDRLARIEKMLEKLSEEKASAKKGN